MNVLSTAVVTITTITRRFSSPPTWRRMSLPAMSITPVRESAEVSTNNPKIITTASLPNPENAFSGGRSPVRIRASSTPRATTSGGIHSVEKKIRAAATMMKSNAICSVI